MIAQKKINEHSVIINPGKALDNSNAHEATEFIAALQAEGYKNIIIDMAELEFLSSAGVGSILGAIGKAREAGGDIILCSVSERVLRILEVLDLCDYLTIKQDEESARQFCLVRD